MSLGKVLSIDIGKGNIHLVVGASKGGVVDIETAIIVPTPSGAVKEGAILDRSSLSFLLNSVIKESNIQVNKAIVTVKSTQVITRELSIPDVPQDDILPLVLLDMEQYLPNISRDYRTGVTILETISTPGGKQIKVRVFAMPNVLAEEYATLLKECKLKPLFLDIHANAINKLIQRNLALNQNTNTGWNWKLAAFVDLGQELTEIGIFDPQKLVFTRQIPYGSGYMDSELIRQLEINEASLVQKKQELCDLSRVDFISDEARRLNDIVRPYVNRVTNEIQTVIQFYSGRVLEKRPEIVYLYGGNAHLRALAENMEKTLGIPVRNLIDCAAIHGTAKVGIYDVLNFANSSAALFRND